MNLPDRRPPDGRPPAGPPYGAATLADLLPSLAAGLGVVGFSDVLGLGPRRRVCVLLVDGLGWTALRAAAEGAPVLGSLGGRPLAVGFPTTTATSMGSFGTGLPPGAHGLVGYEVAVPGTDRVTNSLTWAKGEDPLEWQPLPTVFERVAYAGVSVTRVGPADFETSGLTRAALRGGRFAAAAGTVALAEAVGAALRQGDRSLVYAYHGDLDRTGHVHGVASTRWREELAVVDALVAGLLAVLPPDGTLLVTADHGMVDVALDDGHRIDVGGEPALQAGLRAVAGEPRARHLHTLPGADADVAAAWQDRLGESAWVLLRDEAVALGWYGVVSDRVLPRIGDVVVAARRDIAVVDSRTMPLRLLRLVGQHGAMTEAELLVPLLDSGPGAG